MRVSEKTINSLELPRILEEAAKKAASPPGAERVRSIRPLAEPKEARERFALIGELNRLSDENTPLSLMGFQDISSHLGSLGPPGAMLEGPDMLVFLPALENMERVVEAMEERGDTLPALGEFLSGLSGFPGLLSDLERSIGPEGEVLDSASKELGALRRNLRSLDMKISRRLEEITREPEVETFLQDSFVTKRSGRWVIPVRMDSKGMVKGVVHDVSRTGETAFMEPLEIIGLSNELENLSAEVKAEEIRVLKRLSALIREGAEEILREFRVIVELDMLISLSDLAARLGAEAPSLSEDSAGLRLLGARHPLLLLMPGSAIEQVVPLDMELGPDSRTMVITGPNAGGKTISLKTVGLLMLMASSGLPVPARSESVLPAGGAMLVDIGDEQSIEESLSTFTAHARSIGAIVGEAAPGALVLLDELGTGTDPLQGAAIGCGVLSELHKKGALTVATTHLTEIVAYVHKAEGMVNASMEFHPKEMRPLYRLVSGEPGQSHAIEAAERSGMPPEVIEFARQMAGTERLELERMLTELKEARAGYEARLRETEEELISVRRERMKLEERLSEINREKRRVLKEALEEARAESVAIRKQLNDMLKTAKAVKAPRPALKELDKLGAELDGRIRKLDDSRKKWTPIEHAKIQPGAWVHLSTLGIDAEVASSDVSRKRARIKMGGKELDIPFDSLGVPQREAGIPEKGNKKDASSTQKSGRVGFSGTIDESAPSEIKLIGMRVEEALDKLEPFINHASLAGLPRIRIIHGLGTGALRRAVREHLSTHPLIEGIEEAPPEAGGSGVTEARLG